MMIIVCITVLLKISAMLVERRIFIPFYLPASSESSFSSVDSSNDYCVPPENVSPPEPPALSKGCDELEGIYAEVCINDWVQNRQCFLRILS